MRLLLDTQVFLWFISGDARLPASMLQAVQDPANTVLLSAANRLGSNDQISIGETASA